MVAGPEDAVAVSFMRLWLGDALPKEKLEGQSCQRPLASGLLRTVPQTATHRARKRVLRASKTIMKGAGIAHLRVTCG